MTDVKRLLEEATPLPWSHRPNHKPYHVVAFGKNGWRDGYTTADIERGDAALIVHAVNHLPDYEAAVDALADLIRLNEGLELNGGKEAIEVLRRLRGEVVSA